MCFRCPFFILGLPKCPFFSTLVFFFFSPIVGNDDDDDDFVITVVSGVAFVVSVGVFLLSLLLMIILQ